MATKKKAISAGSTQVRAKVAHTQPGTLAYRHEDEVFVHEGDIYEHVEPVDGGDEVAEVDEEDQ